MDYKKKKKKKKKKKIIKICKLITNM
jgi:hypothetical protein